MRHQPDACMIKYKPMHGYNYGFSTDHSCGTAYWKICVLNCTSQMLHLKCLVWVNRFQGGIILRVNQNPEGDTFVNFWHTLKSHHYRSSCKHLKVCQLQCHLVSCSTAGLHQISPFIWLPEIKWCAPYKSTLKWVWPSCEPQLKRALVKACYGITGECWKTPLLLFSCLHFKEVKPAFFPWDRTNWDHSKQIVTHELPTLVPKILKSR